MGAFAQPDEIFDGDQANAQAEDHIHCDQPSQLKPGDGCAVYAEPQRLPYDNAGVGGWFIREAAMEKVNERQKGAGDGNQHKGKKSPAGPDFGPGLGDEQVESAPTDEDEYQRGEPERLEVERFIHELNYTRSKKVIARTIVLAMTGGKT